MYVTIIGCKIKDQLYEKQGGKNSEKSVECA